MTSTSSGRKLLQFTTKNAPSPPSLGPNLLSQPHYHVLRYIRTSLAKTLDLPNLSSLLLITSYGIPSSDNKAWHLISAPHPHHDAPHAGKNLIRSNFPCCLSYRLRHRASTPSGHRCPACLSDPHITNTEVAKPCQARRNFPDSQIQVTSPRLGPQGNGESATDK